MRLFFAFSLPTPIQRRLEEAINTLRQASGGSARWQPGGNIHLTLKFLGETPANRLEALQNAAEIACQQISAFGFEVGGLGAFPNLNRPRVIWAGVNAPPELAALQQKLEAACFEAGFPREEKPFSPHLTLGRVREPLGEISLKTLRSALNAAHLPGLGQTPAQILSLYRSELSAEGARYSVISSFPLKERGDF